MVLTFFSKGSSCTTSNALAIAMQAASKGAKTVILDLNFDSVQPGQTAFIKDEVAVTGLNYYDNVGLDALIRNVLAKTISKDNILDIQTEIEKNLFYIPKTIKKDKDLFLSDLSKTLKVILRALTMYNDVVVIDAGTWMNDDLFKESDLLIVNLPQNINVLKRYVSELHNDKTFYLVGNHDSASKYSDKRLMSEIKKDLKKKIEISHIPHLAEFSDSIQNTELLNFFNRIENNKEIDFNYKFIKGVKDTYEKICNKYDKLDEVRK